jgi:DNA invertase Pin-like site-specific DNA recombinase
MSGTCSKIVRPEQRIIDLNALTKALELVRPGDVLVVWKLDRLGRSLPHLLSIVNTLKDRQVAFRSLTEGMDTTTASENCCSTFSAHWPSTSGL